MIPEVLAPLPWEDRIIQKFADLFAANARRELQLSQNTELRAYWIQANRIFNYRHFVSPAPVVSWDEETDGFLAKA